MPRRDAMRTWWGRRGLQGSVLLLVGTAVAGCYLLDPKDAFVGVIQNSTDYRVYAWNPGNHEEVYQLDPGQYFSATLEGSERYEFKAWLRDGTVVANFEARINQLPEDARVNGAYADWAWIIGGGFAACPKAGQNSAARVQRG